MNTRMSVRVLLGLLTATLIALSYQVALGHDDPVPEDSSVTLGQDGRLPFPSDVAKTIDRRQDTDKINAMGLTFSPPAEGQEPGISGEEAIARAWAEDAWVDVRSISATYEIFSDSQFSDGQAKSRPTLASRPIASHARTTPAGSSRFGQRRGMNTSCLTAP
jgi:hypothetical protein